MPSYSDRTAVERAQPWLGTLVSVRVSGLAACLAHQATDAAFEEIATVHRRMSFHEPDSDVSRLNRDAMREPVAVHPYTLEVLQWAVAIAARSGGCFDISVGAELVDWGLLPRPAGAWYRPEGSWRDIELRADGRVSFHRPLWIDLGGIAKGYAVDRAVECLRESGAAQAVVNAGGDMRVDGQQLERIGLELEFPVNPMPVIELTDGSVASSSGHRHVHGERRTPLPTQRFVCVVADRCVIADALTKVVMAEGAGSADLLREFGAVAHVHDPLEGWRDIG
jgi:thiamine biosynthesis lipoprotein